ncbi:hypothetical protein AURANDRAFT_68722 [Aureococcus anophagefferens]|uniref:Haem-binding uptake Tiki superfamily ChaN domain-containing protein n=1 Tax=Aureococcus anophagefferens TaxID=44056 RepID=F0YQJ8_AURAN|nr:hypothetical protein AURANDRAFT_68722 [Aureococcus anophagefferens]EGB02610.1 hypothetical protein AURANDRAFT_68722 [Aureococcus anophagefferens]|eukprot:XP_009042690.1 hypothetical protein AURANDRAFT_68722 [Aureococcus anophagefferens]
MWARAVRSVSVSVSAAGVALCEGAPKRRLSTPPPRRRVTPVVDLERDVIVLERQIAGEPLTRVTLSAMVDDMADPDRKLLLFGEQHDDAVAQDVQRAVYDDLTRRRTEKLALALEFIDADARDAARAFSDGSSDDLDEIRDRGIANQEKVFRVAATVAYCLLFLSLVLIGSGIPYAVVGSQMGTAFRYLGKSCNVTDLDYRGSELSLFDSSERYDTWKYTVATRSLDDVPTTYASEVIRVERPGGDRHSKIRAGDVRKCWAPRGGDRRNDLPGILWHGFNCGNKYCLKLEQPAREAAYVRDLGIYFVCFGVIGVVLGCMFDGVAAEALQAKDALSNATSKNQVRWLRPSVAFRKSSISHRQAWQKH